MKNLIAMMLAFVALTLPACATDPNGQPEGDDDGADAGTGSPDAGTTTPDSGTPTPVCTADTWTCGAWDTCSASGSQTRSCVMTVDCDTVTTPSPATTQSCTPLADTHEIYCSALDANGGRTYELRGNLKTGMVDNTPSWTPEYLGYGSDYNGHGWPYDGTPNAATNVGSVIVTNAGATWTASAWTFSQFNAVQGMTPYVASANQVKWVDMAKWTITSGQYCTKSPSGTKLCSCNTLPCTPANAVNAPNCVN